MTMKLYNRIIKQKGIKTILANGPFGLIENRSFRFGTFQVARLFLENQQAFRVYGGGELNHGFNMFSKRFKIDTEQLGEQSNAVMECCNTLQTTAICPDFVLYQRKKFSHG